MCLLNYFCIRLSLQAANVLGYYRVVILVSLFSSISLIFYEPAIFQFFMLKIRFSLRLFWLSINVTLSGKNQQFFGPSQIIAYQISLLCFKVPEQEEDYLLPRKQSCSFTSGLLVIGCLLLLLCGGWLLVTLFWLHRPSNQLPQRHPPPAPAQKTDSEAGINDTSAASRREACSLIPEDWRFDCYPERGVIVTRELCEARNCCFAPASLTSFSATRPPGRNGIPWCFYPPDFPSYSLVSINDTSLGQKGTLVREVKTYYPADILTLDVEIRCETDTRLRVRVSEHAIICTSHSK